MKNITLILLAVIALIGMSACNTVQGFGKDVSKVGQSMENAAAKK